MRDEIEAKTASYRGQICCTGGTVSFLMWMCAEMRTCSRM